METMLYSINIPKEMLPFLDDSREDRSKERFAMMLYPYIRDNTISHGRAAEILGMNKLDLIDLYCTMGLPYLNQPVSELEADLAAFHSTRSSVR